jgi:hypothetical protein
MKLEVFAEGSLCLSWEKESRIYNQASFIPRNHYHFQRFSLHVYYNVPCDAMN